MSLSKDVGGLISQAYCSRNDKLRSVLLRQAAEAADFQIHLPNTTHRPLFQRSQAGLVTMYVLEDQTYHYTTFGSSDVFMGSGFSGTIATIELEGYYRQHCQMMLRVLEELYSMQSLLPPDIATALAASYEQARTQFSRS